MRFVLANVEELLWEVAGRRSQTSSSRDNGGGGSGPSCMSDGNKFSLATRKMSKKKFGKCQYCWWNAKVDGPDLSVKGGIGWDSLLKGI